jgi:hypothetical protein
VEIIWTFPYNLDLEPYIVLQTTLQINRKTNPQRNKTNGVLTFFSRNYDFHTEYTERTNRLSKTTTATKK